MLLGTAALAVFTFAMLCLSAVLIVLLRRESASLVLQEGERGCAVDGPDTEKFD
jgi:hypothetical protein